LEGIDFQELDDVGKPASARFPRAVAILVGSISVVSSRPDPFSHGAAARYIVDIPNDVPNSTTVCRRLVRVSR
jgi:hypothetical protein